MSRCPSPNMNSDSESNNTNECVELKVGYAPKELIEAGQRAMQERREQSE